MIKNNFYCTTMGSYTYCNYLCLFHHVITCCNNVRSIQTWTNNELFSWKRWKKYISIKEAVSDDDRNDEFSDLDDDIANKDCIPSEADMSQSLQNANVDIDVASLETTEVDEITESVSIGSSKRKSDPSKRKKNIR